jgi:hypothetical protein
MTVDRSRVNFNFLEGVKLPRLTIPDPYLVILDASDDMPDSLFPLFNRRAKVVAD